MLPLFCHCFFVAFFFFLQFGSGSCALCATECQFLPLIPILALGVWFEFLLTFFSVPLLYLAYRMIVELHRKVSSLIEFLKQKWALHEVRIVSFSCLVSVLCALSWKQFHSHSRFSFTSEMWVYLTNLPVHAWIITEVSISASLMCRSLLWKIVQDFTFTSTLLCCGPLKN